MGWSVKRAGLEGGEDLLLVEKAKAAQGKRLFCICPIWDFV